MLSKFRCFLENELPGGAWEMTPLPDVDLSLIERFRDALRNGVLESRVKPGKQRKATSVNVSMIVVIALFNFATKHGYIEKSPCGNGKLEKLNTDEAKKPPRFLSGREIEPMREALKNEPDLSDFFEAAIQTGLRRGELLNLRWQDIDWWNNRIHVQPQGSTWQPKTKYAIRKIGIRTDIQQIMERRYAERGSGVYIFGGDLPWDVSWLQRRFKALYKKAGTKDASIHVLRHTFGSHCVLSGLSLYSVSKLMGHASVTTTAIYAHLT